MDLPLIGSNELLYIQTKKVCVTIKGKALHPNFQGIEYSQGDSSIKILGFSDLVIQIDGADYLRLIIEVFPSKIDYQKDYKQIMEDVTKEVYNIAFDFLKKTYFGYRQNDEVNGSPVEFFSVISKIYQDFIKAVDIIMAQPHHVLETKHTVMPCHKVKNTDNKTLRWIEKHPNQIKRVNERILVDKALSVRKQVSYNTKENQFTKYMLISTMRKLEFFKKNYIKLQRQQDKLLINKIDVMIKGIYGVDIAKLVLQRGKTSSSKK